MIKNAITKRAFQTIQDQETQKGFTLIEIMVVIVIIGVLATLIIPRLMSRPDEARVIAARQDVATIVSALKLYRLDIGRYPTSEQGLKALVAKPSEEPIPTNWKIGGYLDRLPNDPWGKPYQYSSPGLKGEMDVFSFGADGKLGGVELIYAHRVFSSFSDSFGGSWFSYFAITQSRSALFSGSIRAIDSGSKYSSGRECYHGRTYSCSN